MVGKIQVNDINFDNCVCIKDKYDRVVKVLDILQKYSFDNLSLVTNSE